MVSKSAEPLLEKGIILNGKWEILGHIASGGMAEVYRARQINLDREVAVKVLSPKFLDSFEGDEEEVQSARERFRREVLAMAQVRHPNVLQVYDVEQTRIDVDGRQYHLEYIVMEYIPGPNLRSTMPPEGFGEDEEGARRWIRNVLFPILDGVGTLHALGIVHRDLKPENVLMDGQTPKITDFGLVGGVRWRGLTQSHHMFGTIHYMAPEQFMEMSTTDSRADIYSLGKILYEAISGKMTKETAYPLKTARLANPQTPFLKRMDWIIQQATAEDKNLRLASTLALKEALADALSSKGPPSAIHISKVGRKGTWAWRLLWGAMVLIVLGGSIAFHLLYHREKTTPSATPPVAITGGKPQPSSLPSGPAQPQREGPSIFPAPSIEGKDGATLRYVPGGTITLPEGFGPLGGQRVEVAPFYMDATEVTNHQYVEFLNQVLPLLKVEDRLVKGNGEIWLILGEVVKGYEPIVYRNGRFHIKDPGFASHPVVRVTGYGAVAYARFYGRRLPMESEWILALRGRPSTAPQGRGESPGGTNGESNPEESGSADMTVMHERMMRPEGQAEEISSHGIPFPVSNFPPNDYGIRGLDSNVQEWGLRPGKPSPKGPASMEFVVFPAGGRSPASPDQPPTPPIQRYPWEAFEEVGFRCVLSVSPSGK